MEGAVILLEWTGMVNNRQFVCLEGELILKIPTPNPTLKTLSNLF